MSGSRDRVVSAVVAGGLAIGGLALGVGGAQAAEVRCSVGSTDYTVLVAASVVRSPSSTACLDARTRRAVTPPQADAFVRRGVLRVVPPATTTPPPTSTTPTTPTTPPGSPSPTPPSSAGPTPPGAPPVSGVPPVPGLPPGTVPPGTLPPGPVPPGTLPTTTTTAPTPSPALPRPAADRPATDRSAAGATGVVRLSAPGSSGAVWDLLAAPIGTGPTLGPDSSADGLLGADPSTLTTPTAAVPIGPLRNLAATDPASMVTTASQVQGLGLAGPRTPLGVPAALGVGILAVLAGFAVRRVVHTRADRGRHSRRWV